MYLLIDSEVARSELLPLVAPTPSSVVLPLHLPHRMFPRSDGSGRLDELCRELVPQRSRLLGSLLRFYCEGPSPPH